VNGYAVGGGAGLALACDLVVAAESARFAYPELKHGIVPALVMVNLVRVLGRKKAFELIATAQPVTAAQALELGMINRVVPGDALVPAALDLAERVSAFSRPAMRLAKSLFYRVLDAPFAEALEHARSANVAMRDLTGR
jgi:enoyl-CoA hydratase/carnithine racemase